MGVAIFNYIMGFDQEPADEELQVEYAVFQIWRIAPCLCPGGNLSIF